MARYNEILVGRFNRALQKAFSMKGEPPAPQLASEITPAIQFGWGVEMRYLEGWNRFGNSNVVAAGGAGNRSGFRIRNPKGSNIVAVIEKIIVAVTTAVDQPILNYNISAAPTLGAASIIVVNTGLDNRGSPTPNCDLSASGNTGALLGITVLQAALALNTCYDFIQDADHQLPLMPDSSYTLYSNNLNQPVLYSIIWRERVMEQSETS